MLSPRHTFAIVSVTGVAGVASCAWVHDISAAMLAGGVVAILIAGMFAMTCWVVGVIRSVNRPADQAYELGYEMGYNKGWQDRGRSDRPRILRALRDEENAG